MQLEQKVNREDIVNEIIELEKRYYKISKLNMKSKELFSKSLKHIGELRLIRSRLKKLKENLTELDEKNEDKKYNKINVPIFDYQMINMDYKYKTKTYEIFSKMMLETDPKKKLNLIDELRLIYRNLINNLEDGDYKIKIQIKYMIIYLNKIARIQKNKIEKSDKKEKIAKNNEIIESMMPDSELYNKILNGEDISNSSLIGIMYAFKDIIQKYDINNNLVKCSNSIINRFDNDNKEFYMNLLYSIIDSIKIRKQNFDKDDNRRVILNQIYKDLKYFEEILNSYDDINSVKSAYLYDIISTLLYDECSYLPIKKLLQNYSKAINATSDKKHIIECILELYLKNYKKAIAGDKTNYINIDYLREVYYMFINDPNIVLDGDVKNRIDKQIENFMQRITNDKNKKQIVVDGKLVSTIFVKNEKRKNYIVEELNKLSIYYRDEKLEYDLKKVNSSTLNEQINCISNMEYENIKDAIDLTSDENIILDNDFIAYNYKSTSSSNILRVSVCDIASLIPEYSDINNYMYNQILENKKIDKRILDRLKFKDVKEVPVITFKISLDRNNNPIDIYIYKSKIKPKRVGRNNTTYRNIIKIVNDIIDKKGYEINTSNNQKIEIVLRNLVNELYLDYVKDKGIPITYSGVERVRDIKPNIYSNIVPILNRISKNQSTNIYNLMTSNLGEFHYSNKPFPVEGYYDLNLVGNPNYIFLENQRIIKSLILNGFNTGIQQYDNIKEALELEHKKMIEDLNSSVGYKPVYDCNQRIKRNTLIS